ncbi:uncharacterized protein LOC5514059 isoform X1 [Nematostella vectensis]|uniref:uncharacterized protein LOC5514059 isoform X1 n=2 Tax=Nematostella vectensis TaxID=45351 RepID=UPI0020773320|nr:uncharacterized protein LOC5514059 isoform X1 [Nematostella vectensis]
MKLTVSDAVYNYRFVNNLWNAASEGDLRCQEKLTTPIVGHVISPFAPQPCHVTEAWGPRQPYQALFYRPSDHTMEAPKTDPLNQNLGSEYSPRFHLQNTHEKGYETTVLSSFDKNLEQSRHHRRQHFKAGTVPGGSTSNKMIYGTNEMLHQENQRRVKQQQEKADGFLFGTDAATNVGKQQEKRKPNNALYLENRTELDFQRNKKLANEQDEFMEKHIQEKRRQRMREQEEKKKDLEMLKNLNPWGRPGHGAPMFAPTEQPAAKRTKAVNELVGEHYQPLGGDAGGGNVNRTASGKPQPTYKIDPELRFQKYSDKKNVEPQLRYRKDIHYGKELDSLLEEAKSRKQLQRRDSLEKELRHISHDPFGKQGGGAPLKNRKGELQAVFPTTLSKDIQELRQVEPRHSHAYNATNQEDFGNYDPWGKGYGVPRRDERGRLIRQNHKDNNDNLDGVGILIGRPGCGAPLKDDKGRVQARKAQTLTKTASGQTLPREFSPKGVECYNPFGRPGAGAPVRGADGTVKTHIMGKVEKDAVVLNDPSPRTDPATKHEYLQTLRNMTEEAREQRKAEKEELKTDGADVAAWLRKGVIGQPQYDPVTGEIVASHKHTSDITQQKLNIRRQKNELSHQYHQDLERLAQEREKDKVQRRDLEHRHSREHVDTMNSIWGRPGAGAPLTRDHVKYARKQKTGLDPIDVDNFRDY